MQTTSNHYMNLRFYELCALFSSAMFVLCDSPEIDRRYIDIWMHTQMHMYVRFFVLFSDGLISPLSKLITTATHVPFQRVLNVHNVNFDLKHFVANNSHGYRKHSSQSQIEWVIGWMKKTERIRRWSIRNLVQPISDWSKSEKRTCNDRKTETWMRLTIN